MQKLKRWAATDAPNSRVLLVLAFLALFTVLPVVIGLGFRAFLPGVDSLWAVGLYAAIIAYVFREQMKAA